MFDVKEQSWLVDNLPLVLMGVSSCVIIASCGYSLYKIYKILCKYNGGSSDITSNSINSLTSSSSEEVLTNTFEIKIIESHINKTPYYTRLIGDNNINSRSLVEKIVNNDGVFQTPFEFFGEDFEKILEFTAYDSQIDTLPFAAKFNEKIEFLYSDFLGNFSEERVFFFFNDYQEKVSLGEIDTFLCNFEQFLLNKVFGDYVSHISCSDLYEGCTLILYPSSELHAANIEVRKYIDSSANLNDLTAVSVDNIEHIWNIYKARGFFTESEGFSNFLYYVSQRGCDLMKFDLSIYGSIENIDKITEYTNFLEFAYSYIVICSEPLFINLGNFFTSSSYKLLGIILSIVVS